MLLSIILFLILASLYFKVGGDLLYEYLEKTTSSFGVFMKKFFDWEGV